MGPIASKSADDIHGLEFDWLACDEDQHVAMFSTAGTGYAPSQYLHDSEAHDAAIDAILALPVATVAIFAPVLAPGLANTWKLMAERGLYAFDADPSGGPYRLVAAPAVPTRADALPAAIVEIVTRIRLSFRFEACQVVTDEQIRRALGG